MKKYMKEILLLTVCIVVLAGSISALIGIWNMYRKGQKEYEDLKEFVDNQDETEPESEGGSGDVKIDFEGLKALNPDIVAWIRCTELGIDYPVVRGEDNDYYLHRTFTGEDHIAGCIFMDYRNLADFTSPRTILYGHNMKDGSMFGSLKQHPDMEGNEVTVYLPDGVLEFTVTSSELIRADDERYHLEKVDEQQVEGELLLSTCSSDEMMRLVVTCKLIEIQENTDEIQVEHSTDPIINQTGQETEYPSL